MATAAGAKAGKSDPRRRDPEGSKRLLLDAATAEFSSKGLKGARVDEIARRAGVNKQLVYHHFGNKDDLYLRCLEASYERFRARDENTDLEKLPPDQAIAALVGDTFDNVRAQRYFAALVMDENLHSARHIKRSSRLKQLHAQLLKRFQGAIDRGIEAGIVRRGTDAFQLYVSIASLASFYFTNNRTLSAVFGRDLESRRELQLRREHIVDLIMSAIRA